MLLSAIVELKSATDATVAIVAPTMARFVKNDFADDIITLKPTAFSLDSWLTLSLTSFVVPQRTTSATIESTIATGKSVSPLRV